MRTVLLVAACFGLIGTPAFAQHSGGPCPELSIVEVPAPPVGCQYRFNAAGTLDEIEVIATLVDCDGIAVPDHAVEVTLEVTGATSTLCGCESLTQSAVSDANGIATFRFRRLGGHGSLRACVSSSSEAYRIGCANTPFTTPDLNASCDPAPAVSTTVIDLAHWASGLGVYDRPSDYDCSGSIDILDLALWASGLGHGCD